MVRSGAGFNKMIKVVGVIMVMVVVVIKVVVIMVMVVAIMVMVVHSCVQVSTGRRVQGLVKKSRWVRSMQLQGPKWFLKAFALARKRRRTAFDHT